jgi:nicotinamide-nucleotide adenylyltransferase
MKKVRNFSRALFIGRFQPFHNGHLRVIKDIMKENGRIAIAIAGPEKSDEKNPFSFDERKKMIRIALKKEGISGYGILGIRDVDDDKKWAEIIRSMNGFDVAYSRNPWVIRCLKMAGIRVKKHKFYERYKNCGRIIRERIKQGKNWTALVPLEVYDYIKKINGVERISGA